MKFLVLCCLDNRTTIIIDHFEDLMHLFDAEVLIRARETYADVLSSASVRRA